MPREGESTSSRLDPRDQSGIALIETLVAAILLVIVSVGVFSAFDAATRSSAEERHRARAHALAQSDLSRMRTMRISDLSNLNQTRTVNQDGQTYTIHSLAEYQTDATGTQSCEAGTASADYIKISSSVTWSSIGTRPPVVAATLVAPPNGSISADSGSLAIQVVDSQDIGVAGIGLAGSGAGSFSGSTGANGCAIFGNLPEGDYTLTLSGFASGLVDKDGNPPGSITTSVVGESTNTVVLQYDSPGEIVDQLHDALVRRRRRALDRRLPDRLQHRDDVLARVPADAGGQGLVDHRELDVPVQLRLRAVREAPAAATTRTRSTSTPRRRRWRSPACCCPRAEARWRPCSCRRCTSPSTRARTPPAPGPSGATIKARDTLCSNFLRTFTANTQGQLDDPGLPYTDYSVCAHGLVGGVNRRRTQNVSMNDPPDVTGGQTVNVFLTGGTSQAGTCP